MHVVSDEERREVARRLREIMPCKSGHIKWWEIARALGLKQPAGWFGWEKFEPDSANRLADLIKPPYPDATASYKGWRAEVYDPDGVLASPSNVAVDLVRAHADGKMRHSTKEEQNEYSTMLKKMSVEMHPVDRDALLALADRMEEMAGKGACLTPDGLEKAAEAIREALGGGVVSETYVTLSKTFLAHVTGLSLCEGDGEDVMALVECDGPSGSASWLAAPDEAPELETVSRVTVEALT